MVDHRDISCTSVVKKRLITLFGKIYHLLVKRKESSSEPWLENLLPLIRGCRSFVEQLYQFFFHLQIYEIILSVISYFLSSMAIKNGKNTLILSHMHIYKMRIFHLSSPSLYRSNCICQIDTTPSILTSLLYNFKHGPGALFCYFKNRLVRLKIFSQRHPIYLIKLDLRLNELKYLSFLFLAAKRYMLAEQIDWIMYPKKLIFISDYIVALIYELCHQHTDYNLLNLKR